MSEERRVWVRLVELVGYSECMSEQQIAVYRVRERVCAVVSVWVVIISIQQY